MIPDTNLYVITPIFNPMQFESRARLYKQFAKHMRETGAILITVEAAFGDHDFEVTDPLNPFNIQVRTDVVLWHKESLIKLGIQKLTQMIPAAKNIFWIDADVTFLNPDWVAESVHKLMHHHVIQPFAEAINLNSSEQYMWHCPSTFRSFIEGRGYHQQPEKPLEYIFRGHPGLAWGASREALDTLGGLFNLSLAGSADTVMANCLKGKWNQYLPGSPSPGMVAAIKRWSDRCDKHIKGNVGFTRGTVCHHWHGKSEKRGYEKRWDILSFHQFDPDTDLVEDTQGLFRWAGNKPAMEDDIRLSLTSRNEDEP